MPNKSWKAKLAHKDPQPAQPAPETLQRARQVQDNIQADAKIEREMQGELLQELSRRHGWDIPVPELWKLRAMRLGGIS